MTAMASVSCSSCSSENQQDATANETTEMENTQINEPEFDIVTTHGTMRVKLYSKTPKHRDNFAKLVSENYYDGIRFHRVIEGFMIQTGDPFSRDTAKINAWGTGGPDYTVPAEFVNEYWHKKGALAAARKGDLANPKKASSGSQFYIVWGKTYNEGQIGQLGKQLEVQAQQQIFNQLVMEHRSEIMEMRRNRDQAGLQELQDDLVAQMKAIVKEQGPFGLSDIQKEAYKTIGGTPHLDGQYTVFGEVIEGLEIVEQIQNCETGAADRPKTDISMTVSIEE